MSRRRRSAASDSYASSPSAACRLAASRSCTCKRRWPGVDGHARVWRKCVAQMCGASVARVWRKCGASVARERGRAKGVKAVKE
eukprot:223697-Chlamydomonas_euryale.AAC.1